MGQFILFNMHFGLLFNFKINSHFISLVEEMNLGIFTSLNDDPLDFFFNFLFGESYKSFPLSLHIHLSTEGT